MSTSIVKEYLDLTEKHKETYGEKCAVLLQVGAFFEIYGLRADNNDVFGSNIEEICEICELNMTNKQMTHTDATRTFKKNQKVNCHTYPVMMAGFKDYNYEKYVQKLLNCNYVVAIYVQEKNDKVITRKLDCIYSPGTYFSVDKNDKITNNIGCIWMEKFTRKSGELYVVYGVSVVDILTGKSHIFEHETEFSMNPTTFDELERIMSTFTPSELVVVSDIERTELQSIFQFINAANVMTHYVTLSNSCAINCSKQTYIHNILESFFGKSSVTQCKEFNQYEMATQSFCFLLNYIQEHNFSLTKHIDCPLFNNHSSRMILANHTLSQLNIISDGQHKGHLSSVCAFLNKCITPMGKRAFDYMLTNPTFDKEYLHGQYDQTAAFMASHCVEEIRISLRNVKDLEKIMRSIVLKKAYPSHLYQIYNSISIITNINGLLRDEKILDFDVHMDNIKQFFEQNFILTQMQNINSLTYDVNFIQKNVSEKLDDLLNTQRINNKLYDEIHIFFNELMRQKEEKTEYVKKHETNKTEALVLTKKRAKTLSGLLINRDVTICNHTFNLTAVTFKSAGASNDELTFPLLNEVLRRRLSIQDDIQREIGCIYMGILEHLCIHLLDIVKMMSNCLRDIDVFCNKAHVSKKYNYCKPTICDGDESHSFVKATKMRHCLIEQLISDNYVTNDVHLGTDGQNGMLLYGTNAVGKTSYIRAIGICIILAQCGMYVPCSEFVFRPYESIFSRILGNDNLFKGMSTFAVEISELRVILRMANRNSLILGDEVCSGTETESALSIFMSALMRIHSQNSSFIFATHFHEILNYDEMESLTNMAVYHMHVFFDREKQTMSYERLLKPGPGTRNYGLEVCKSLYVDGDFMEQTYVIRNKYFPENRGVLSQKPSRYNAKKLKGMCEMCNKVFSSEVHHKQQQKDADSQGYISNMHKNHVSNLMNLCEKCHKKEHNDS
jgi:DNA mismatch repair protein MutS